MITRTVILAGVTVLETWVMSELTQRLRDNGGQAQAWARAVALRQAESRDRARSPVRLEVVRRVG